MFSVFYANDIKTGTLIFGETDGKIIDKEYMKVNGQLIHRAYIFLNTPTNLVTLNKFREDYKAWLALEPNIYSTLNQMKRI